MLNVISKTVSVILVTVLTAVNATAVFAATPAQQTDQTIVDIAVADGRFTDEGWDEYQARYTRPIRLPLLRSAV